MSDSETMWDLEKGLRAEVRERADELLDNSYPEDTLHEMADTTVPLYTSTLLEVAAHDTDMAVLVPDIGPAFDGTATPVNIIAANIYERLLAVAHEEWQVVKSDQEEYEADEAAGTPSRGRAAE